MGLWWGWCACSFSTRGTETCMATLSLLQGPEPTWFPVQFDSNVSMDHINSSTRWIYVMEHMDDYGWLWMHIILSDLANVRSINALAFVAYCSPWPLHAHPVHRLSKRHDPGSPGPQTTRTGNRNSKVCMIYHDYARESGGFRVSIDHLLPQIHGWRELLLIMSSRWFQGKISKRKPWFSPSDMRVSWVSCNFSLDPIQKNIIPLRTCGSTRLPQPCTPASPGGVPAAESTGKGETHIDRDQLVACHENIVRKYCFRKKLYIYNNYYYY